VSDTIKAFLFITLFFGSIWTINTIFENTFIPMLVQMFLIGILLIAFKYSHKNK